MTPTRLYPLHCTLYLCTPTLTRRHLQALVALFHALVSNISFQFLQCALHWLQLRKLLKLSTSLRSHKFVISFFLWKLTEATKTLNFERLFYCLYLIVFLAQFSTLGSAHRLYRLLLFNPVCPFLFVCVIFRPTSFLSLSKSYPVLRVSVHSFALQCLPFFIFLGRIPCTPLDFANLLRTFKHVL